MKFTIEVEDFYMDSDDEQNLEKDLKSYIIRDVTNQIMKSIKEKVDVEDNMFRFMNISIEEIIQTEKIKKDNKEITLVEYIKDHFQNRNSYRSADEVITREAEKFAKEMKNRYDLLFASQLVAKMSNAGMLKEDVAKILLEQPK